MVHIGGCCDDLAGSDRGRVSDTSGVKSLQSAEVEIVELQRRAQTGSDGGFRFGDVPDGAYTLRTQYVGADAVETKVNVSDDTRSADILFGASNDVVRNFINGNSAGFELNETDTEFESNIADYNVDEDVHAGGRKRLLQYEEYSWTGKAGFRYTF